MAKKKVDPLEGKVLVPKPERLEDFKAIMVEMATIAHGSLGWQGQAEIFYELDFEQIFGYKLKAKTKKGQINEIKKFIQQCFMDKLMEVSEWLPEEGAAARMTNINTLFVDDLNDGKKT